MKKRIFVVKVIEIFNCWLNEHREPATIGDIIEMPDSSSVCIEDNLIIDWEESEYGFYAVKGEIIEVKELDYGNFKKLESWVRYMNKSYNFF